MEDWLEPFYEHKNYKIVTGNSKSKLCLVAFSSNALYQYKTLKENVEQLNTNRFEYERVLNDNKILKKFNKIIFLRDVTRKFYFYGINKYINSISKILEFLSKETGQLKCYVMGNSSGGFMAMLVGYYLKNVTRVYSFGGVIDPLNWHGPDFDYNVSDYLIFENMDLLDKEYAKVKNNIANFRKYYYCIYSHFSLADQNIIRDFRKAKNKNIKIVELKTDNHGDYIWSYDYKYLLLKKSFSTFVLFSLLNNRLVSKALFSLLNQGFFCISSKIKSYKKHYDGLK